MDFFHEGMNVETSEIPFNHIQRCPFLRNINEPIRSFFLSPNFSFSVEKAKGPIFEDGPNFDMAFNLFHGRHGVVPLSGRSYLPDDKLEKTEPAPRFNPLAAKAATVSLSAFGTGEPFDFGILSTAWKNQKKISESSKKRKSSSQAGEAKGPSFEDGPNFDMAFKLFHGMDGVVPLSGRTYLPDAKLETELAPQFNRLAAKAATMSLSAFGPGGLLMILKNQKKKSKLSKKRKSSSQGGDSSKHEALGNVWLETGNCTIAKSYRAVRHVLLVAAPFQPQPGMKLGCSPAVDAARDALAQTALDKTQLLQILHAKMFVMGVLGIAAKNPLGIWMKQTRNFFLSWFAALHRSVPSIAMLRKSALMPKNAMAFSIAIFILGLVIGSLVVHILMKTKAESEQVAAQVPNAGAKAKAEGDKVAAQVAIAGAKKVIVQIGVNAPQEGKE